MIDRAVRPKLIGKLLLPFNILFGHFVLEEGGKYASDIACVSL